ncbi:MAG: hypothetical protein HYR76_10745 [Ignavibacteria bacterium]|nr:hypothetical protein [Ignavibacteria bacterium]
MSLVLVVLFLLLRSFRRFRAWPLLVAAGVWGVFAPWEWYCKVQGYNIRVDLFLIYPVLVSVTVWGLIASVQKR